MSVLTPVIREFVVDRRAHTRVASAQSWSIDRTPRSGGKRQFRFYRTLVGALLSGPGVISGVLTVDGVPARRRVVLHTESDGVRMRDGFSSAVDGTFSFDLLPDGQPYTVIAYDDTGAFQALIWNGVIPTV